MCILCISWRNARSRQPATNPSGDSYDRMSRMDAERAEPPARGSVMLLEVV